MFHARRGHFPFFLFSAVLSSLRMGKPSVAIHPDVLEATHPAAIPPPEPPPGGENLALPAEGVGYFLSLFLRCSALSLSSVRSSASRLARVVLVNTRHLLCGSRTFFFSRVLFSRQVVRACKSALLAYVAFLMVFWFWPYVLSKVVFYGKRCLQVSLL